MTQNVTDEPKIWKLTRLTQKLTSIVHHFRMRSKGPKIGLKFNFVNRTKNVGLSNCTSFLAQQLNSTDYGSRNSHRGSWFVPLELARDSVVGSVPRRPAAAKAPKTAMNPVIRNLHRGSCFVPLELARDSVVGSVPRRPAAAKAPKTEMNPVIRNLRRGSWLVPLQLARDGVVGSVPRRPAAAKAPKTVWCSQLPSRLQVRLALLLLRLSTPRRRRSRSSTWSILIVTDMWSDPPFHIYA